ncbi:MAG TPA: NADH-quinone oxidoreductase subunit L [Candidatus Micrarchaeia archaeon]|nr:NADH-quinone oxidoreductase subunit L [Candidatus Micrarchaeia archaeon]
MTIGTGFATALAAVVLGLPLLGFLAISLVGGRLPRRLVRWLGPGVVLLAFVGVCVLLAATLMRPAADRSVTVVLWQWLQVGVRHWHGVAGTKGFSADFSVTLDPLALVMAAIITGVGGIIHVYSVGYMAADQGFNRFFAYMNLFVTSMLVLVLSANLVFLVIGWSMVAFTSYALIAFWHDRPAAVAAGRKAYITQVIGDLALVLAAFLIFTNLRGPSGRLLHTVSLPAIFANVGPGAHFHDGLGPTGGALVTLIGILLFIGAAAKSAQWPLHTWLPDAMEGPTPVSALIHAATMVTAGVYLVVRFHPVYQQAPIAAGAVAVVGIGTAWMAGVIGCTQYDIKRVIAYSTMSQIGLMIFAAGIGAYSAAIFHLLTHAFFKALLFLAAGNVIHALHDDQDVRVMGGLRRRMRLTYPAFLVGSLALAGIPIFAGWFSKEELLGSGLVLGPITPWLWVIGLSLNVLTSFYIFRVVWLAFHGTPRSPRAETAREAPRVMTAPVLVLAGLATVAGFLEVNFAGWRPINLFAAFLQPVVGAAHAHPQAAADLTALVVGTLLSLFGIGLATMVYRMGLIPADLVSRRAPWLYRLSLHKFYWDQIYDLGLTRPTLALARVLTRVVEPNIFDGAVRGVRDAVGALSQDFRSFQTGYFRGYATVFFAFAAIALLVLGLRLT